MLDEQEAWIQSVWTIPTQETCVLSLSQSWTKTDAMMGPNPLFRNCKITEQSRIDLDNDSTNGEEEGNQNSKNLKMEKPSVVHISI